MLLELLLLLLWLWESLLGACATSATAAGWLACGSSSGCCAVAGSAPPLDTGNDEPEGGTAAACVQYLVRAPTRVPPVPQRGRRRAGPCAQAIQPAAALDAAAQPIADPAATVPLACKYGAFISSASALRRTSRAVAIEGCRAAPRAALIAKRKFESLTRCLLLFVDSQRGIAD